MRRPYVLAAALAVGATGGAFLLVRKAAGPESSGWVQAQSAAGARSPDRIAAPGVVEAASEEVAIGAEIAGRLRSVAEEGEHVTRGQIVAALDQSVARERVEAAEAEVKLRKADLDAIRNGANNLQRTEAWVKYKQSQTATAEARAEYDRRKKLFEEGAIAEEELQRSASELEAAQQREEEANLQRRIVAAPALDTDRERAEAALMEAQAGLDEARIVLEKTNIRAPIAGVVVHKFLKVGEMASATSGAILTVADTSRLRVRAEIDEADVGSVRVGESAYVTAAAFGERRFAGRVIRVASALGRKKTRTGEPSERVDTRVLETLIELDSSASLPLGLRVTCFIRTGA
ncbi:MAG: efflux RND transporter periplasmic adaptor subunit [Acidobacteriaceae bacterium]|nr:efflux RND transporter periplasmic adaptor subunit [Acidobacteriaceae bacterium]